MNEERYEDCEKCNESFVGERAIRDYLRSVDKRVLFKGSMVWECSTICIDCLAEEDKSSAWVRTPNNYSICLRCQSTFNLDTGCTECLSERARM
jgi:hypothetical protein